MVWKRMWVYMILGLALGAMPVRAQEAQGIDAKNMDAAPNDLPTHMVKVLRTSNKAQTTRYVPKVYDVKNVNPADVMRFIRRTAEIEDSAWYTYVAPDGKSGKVVVIVPEYQIPYIDKLMAQIDRVGLTTSSGTVGTYYRLKHRSTSDTPFLSTLAEYVTPDAKQMTDPEINAVFLYDTASASSDWLAAMGSLDVPTPQIRLDVTLYEIDFENDGALGLDFYSWKNGPGRKLFAAQAYSEREKFHDWPTNDKTEVSRITPIFNSGIATSTISGQSWHASGSNSAYFLDMPSAYFDALSAKGKARVKSKGSLTVLHSQTATLQTTDSILYFAVKDAVGNDLSLNANAIASAVKGGFRPVGKLIDTTPNIDSATGNPVLKNDPNFPDNRTVVGTVAGRQGLTSFVNSTDTGVYVQVTPTIGTDLVNLNINMVVLNNTGFADNGRPLIARRASNTQVKATNGQEVVMSGMVHETVLNTTRKVPVLGSLPVVGYLFGGELNQTQKRLVVLVVTPTVVDDYSGMRSEDKDVIQKAKGEKAIKMPVKTPVVDVPLGGDPIWW